MTTHTCNIDSLESLAEAQEFFEKNHDKYAAVVFNITGCVPLACAPILLSAVRRAKDRDKLSFEGLPLLKDMKKRARELERRRDLLQTLANINHDDFEDYPYHGNPDTHTVTYNHTTDMQRLQSSVQTMDISAFRQLDKDILGNIRRYEHHRAMFEDTKAEALEKWIPSIDNELYK
jgi:hypothetical protein